MPETKTHVLYYFINTFKKVNVNDIKTLLSIYQNCRTAERVGARIERERVRGKSEVIESEGSNHGGGKFALKISLICPFLGYRGSVVGTH